MYNKKLLILIFLTLLFILLSFSMSFSDTKNNKLRISNRHAIAIYTVIFDLYKTQNKSNMNNFPRQFIKEYGDIEIQDGKDGIWIYVPNGNPEMRGGDATYLIDRDNFTIIKREFGQ